MNDEQILAALARIEAGQAELRAGLPGEILGEFGSLRAELMIGMDRLEARMDSLERHIKNIRS